MIHYKINPKSEIRNPKFNKTDCLVVPVFEDKAFEKTAKELDSQYNGLLSDVKKSEDFTGKKMETCLLYTQDKNLPRILLIGLGKEKELNVRTWKQHIGFATAALQSKKFLNLGFVIPNAILKSFGAKKAGKLTCMAIELANYSFDEHKKDKDERIKPLKQVFFTGEFDASKKRDFITGVEMATKIAEAVNFTRHLGNVTPTVMTPSYLAQEAIKISQENSKLKTKILSIPDMKKLGMGCLLGVSSGSAEEPKFIIMEYKGAKADEKPTVLVGKGITFDSGGLSLKPSNYMKDMKFDMLGAATVLGIIKAAADLQLKKNLVVLIPACENMPGGAAYRPDDILIALNGKSILVENTDAEGRLILADALSYASKYKPKEVIDFATLTGACMVALGNERSGLFSDEEKIVERLQKSSLEVGEQFWRLPLGEEYSEAVKAETADVKNTGSVPVPGYGGASTAAAFLQNFVDYPWAHIDLSCSYYGEKGKPWIRTGANGFGVETLIDYLS